MGCRDGRTIDAAAAAVAAVLWRVEDADTCAFVLEALRAGWLRLVVSASATVHACAQACPLPLEVKCTHSVSGCQPVSGSGIAGSAPATRDCGAAATVFCRPGHDCRALLLSGYHLQGPPPRSQQKIGPAS